MQRNLPPQQASANEYSGSDVESPVLKSSGYAVTLQPTASNLAFEGGMCQADVTSNHGNLHRSPSGVARIRWLRSGL